MVCPKCKGYHFHIHRMERGLMYEQDGTRGCNVIVTYRCPGCEKCWRETVFVKEENRGLYNL